ncbi:MAG: hypothetical protein O2819_03625 [Planctomycetota bacterium]|nr:hypothetical protein [Planctomycetota bacterium]MDA1105586.1 hypothetical protein [Planctomycetota bacterium]
MTQGRWFVVAAGALLTPGVFLLAACAPRTTGSIAPAPFDAAVAPPGPLAAAGALATALQVPVVIEERDDGLLLLSPSYAIHTTLHETRLRAILPGFQEAALKHYRSAIVPLPAPLGALTSFVYRTRPEWIAHAERDLGEDAAIYRRIGRGGYTRHGISVLYDIGYFDTLTIAAHEGWHQYAQSTFGSSLPPWLDEGMATYCEGCVGLRSGEPEFRPWRNMERYSALQDLVSANAVRPLEVVITGTPQGFLLEGRDALLDYYAHVWVLIHFLAEYDHGRYRPALERMLTDAAAGRVRDGGAGPRRLRDQFREVFGVDASSLDADFRRFVQAVTARGASGWIYRGESPYANQR